MRFTRHITTFLTPALLLGSVAVSAEKPRARGVIKPVVAESSDRAEVSTALKTKLDDKTIDLIDGELTLDDLVNLAEENNPILKRARARIASAQGDSLQAGLWENPKFDTNNPQVFAGRNSAFNGGFAQEIPVMGKKRLDRAAGEKAVHQQQYAYVQDRIELLTNVRQQFFTVLAAQRRVQVYSDLYEITRSSTKTAYKVFEAGESGKIDALLLQIDSETVSANLANSERLLEGARRQLAATVGVQYVANRKMKGRLDERPPEYDDLILKEFVTNQSAQIQIARLDIDRNQILLRRADVEKYPNPYIGPAYNVGVSPGQDAFWFNISFPIAVWNRNQGGVASARANVRQSQENLNATQLDQLRKLADAYARYQAAQAQADKYRDEIIPHTIEAYKFAREGWREKTIDMLRFLQTQRTVVEAHVTNLSILESLWQSSAELAGLLQLDQFP